MTKFRVPVPAYLGLIIANLMLIELTKQYYAGALPLPAGYDWLWNILAVGITGLSMLLPRILPEEPVIVPAEPEPKGETPSHGNPDPGAA